MNLGENNILGGYLLLDFKGVPLTSSFKLTKGVRKALERNGDRPVVLVNVYKNGTPYRDTYCEVRMNGVNYCLYAHGFKITVNSNSQSKIEADELHQQVDALEDRVDLLEENVEDINETLTPAGLLDKLIEGSEYISVDENEGGTKVVVELDETKFDDEPTEDSDNLITSGAVYDAFVNAGRTVKVNGDGMVRRGDGKRINLIAGQNITLVRNDLATDEPTLTINATGGSGSTDVFWATRGITTAAEVETAINEGKMVRVMYSGYEYGLCNSTSTYFYFSNASSTALKQMTLKKADSTWSAITTITVQKLLNTGDGITIDSNNVISFTGNSYMENVHYLFGGVENAPFMGGCLSFSFRSKTTRTIETMDDLINAMYAEGYEGVFVPNGANSCIRDAHGSHTTDAQYIITGVKIKTLEVMGETVPRLAVHYVKVGDVYSEPENESFAFYVGDTRAISVKEIELF